MGYRGLRWTRQLVVVHLLGRARHARARFNLHRVAHMGELGTGVGRPNSPIFWPLRVSCSGPAVI